MNEQQKSKEVKVMAVKIRLRRMGQKKAPLICLTDLFRMRYTQFLTLKRKLAEHSTTASALLHHATSLC